MTWFKELCGQFMFLFLFYPPKKKKTLLRLQYDKEVKVFLNVANDDYNEDGMMMVLLKTAVMRGFC